MLWCTDNLNVCHNDVFQSSFALCCFRPQARDKAADISAVLHHEFDPLASHAPASSLIGQFHSQAGNEPAEDNADLAWALLLHAHEGMEARVLGPAFMIHSRILKYVMDYFLGVCTQLALQKGFVRILSGVFL